MAKKKPAVKEIAVVEELPDYLIALQEEHGTGLEEAQDYISPARLKIVQSQTSGDVGDKFAPGDVVLMPQLMRLAEMEYDGAKPVALVEKFTFVPLFFFPEWITINKWGSGLPFIRDRSSDRKSLLAQKAKDPNTRLETIDGEEVRHVEVLNFMIKLDHSEFGDIPAVLSFSKGEWRKGSNLITLMKTRHVAMYHQRFEASVSQRENDDGKWFGFDIEMPSENGFVSEEYAADYAAMHKRLKEAHGEAKIVVNHDEEDGQATHTSEEF